MYTSIDSRRDLAVPGDHKATIAFCLDHIAKLSQESIKDHGAFFIALSGGSTPKTIYQHLTQPPYRDQIEWSGWHLFWSDERSVPPEDPASNYHMAMEAGFKRMPIPAAHIHRMHAEDNIQKNADAYEADIRKTLQGRPFDLIMLGMGEDGHTASLFPGTAGLQAAGKLIIANFIPQQNTWRMTMTFDCINQASHIAIYVLGASKKEMLAKVLTSPQQLFPSQRVGTPQHKALWIADTDAASLLLKL